VHDGGLRAGVGHLPAPGRTGEEVLVVSVQQTKRRRRKIMGTMRCRKCFEARLPIRTTKNHCSECAQNYATRKINIW
jgi:hypothetical protein